MALLPPLPLTEPVTDPQNQLLNDTYVRWFQLARDTLNTTTTNFAPSSATYIIKTANVSIPNAQVLASLSTGFAKIATGTGIISTQATINSADLTNTAVTAATYTINGHNVLIVNAKGQLTSAFNVTVSASDITTGTLPAAQLPNPTASTLGGVESLAAVTSKWINTISTSGVPSATQPAESDLSFTDITTNNVSATQHGFAPKFPNNTTTFLRGDGTYATPAGGGTVTSVATSGLATGGTITSTGTITVTAAVKSDQTTGSSNSVAVTPGVQQNHESAVKASGLFAVSGGAVTTSYGYGISSVTYSSAGIYLINFSVAFTSVHYVVVPVISTQLGALVINAVIQSASQVQIRVANLADTINVDPTAFSIICCGTQ